MGKFGGDYRGGVAKVACWSTKAAISLKRVKIDEKLLWRAYTNSPTLFERYHLDPLRPPLCQVGGSQPPPKTAIDRSIISGAGKATDFIFIAGTFTASIRTKYR